MRLWLIACIGLLACVEAFARKPASEIPVPAQFEIGRRTFFDFGPPFDYYEVLIVRASAAGSSIERVTLTPPGNACTESAKVETASASVAESVAALLGGTNPCAIPEKELRHELKRCKKCLVFSGADVAMKIQCGTQHRIIRADILDRDMFDPKPDTPQHTSWTMQLLQRLDSAVGPGVVDKPIFPVGDQDTSAKVDVGSQSMRDVAGGEYDVLFQGAPDKPSVIFRNSQVQLPKPSVRLVNTSPFSPQEFISPVYPLIAKLAHVEGEVFLSVKVDAQGIPSDIAFVSGHPLLRGAVTEAVKKWRFPAEAKNSQVEATIDFDTNCVRKQAE
jgi:TonB family protein